jgi:tetratricopeptide (TPR) repeat protein
VIVSVARVLCLVLLAAATAGLPARAAVSPAVPGSAAVPAASPAATPAPDPAGALDHYLTGLLLEERGLAAEALQEYVEALRLDPGRSGIELRAGDVAARLGDSPRSLDFALDVLQRDPGNAYALWLKGGALVNLGRPKEALTALRAAVAADSARVDYWRTLARVADLVDDVDVAADGWRHTLERDDSDGEAWFQLAAIETRRGHYAVADSLLAEASALNPARPGTVFLAAWIQDGLGHPAEAARLYRQHLEMHPDDQVSRRRLVNLLVGAERYAEAYDEVDRVRQAEPDDLDAVGIQADIALRLGRTARANELLDQLTRGAPDDPARAAQAVAILVERGQGSDAAVRAEDWARGHAADYRGAMLLAQARAVVGDSNGAEAAARHAVELAPDSLAPRFALGGLLQGQGRFAAAESVWAELVRSGRSPVRSGLQLAYCRERLGDVDGAAKAVRAVLRIDPENSAALNTLGYLLADHGRDLAEAEGLVRKALAREPDNGAYLDSRGWVYYRQGRLDEARKDLERAVDLTDRDPVVCEHLGDVYKDLKLMELARKQYELSLARDRGNARVRAKLDGLR